MQSKKLVEIVDLDPLVSGSGDIMLGFQGKEGELRIFKSLIKPLSFVRPAGTSVE
jgi:hypothetical protein